SATAQNFSDEPAGLSSATRCRSIHCWVSGSRCERLTATCQPSGGGRRTRIGFIPSNFGSASALATSRRCAFAPPAQCRRVDGACHRRSALDQRDVDGELLASLDELPCAIERIDEDEALGIVDGRSCTALLGDDGNPGEIPGKSVADDLVGGEVGGGDR